MFDTQIIKDRYDKGYVTDDQLDRYVALGDEGLGQTATAPLAAFAAPMASPGAASVAPPAVSPGAPTHAAAAPTPENPPPKRHAFAAWLDAQERQLLAQALQTQGGDITAAAAHLGLEPTQIQYRLQRLHLPHPTAH